MTAEYFSNKTLKPSPQVVTRKSLTQEVEEKRLQNVREQQKSTIMPDIGRRKQ